MENASDLGPAGAKVGTSQGIQILSFGSVPTMRHQVNFQEPWAFVIPGRERVYGDQVFEQTTGFGSAQTMMGAKAHRTQAAVNAGRTDLQEAFFCVLGKFDFSATFQDFDGFWQKRLQSLGADAPIDLPDLLEYPHNFAPINTLVGFGVPLMALLPLDLALEHTNGVFPMVTRRKCKLVQHLLFFSLLRL
jgi:hypothetical protein